MHLGRMYQLLNLSNLSEKSKTPISVSGRQNCLTQDAKREFIHGNFVLLKATRCLKITGHNGSEKYCRYPQLLCSGIASTKISNTSSLCKCFILHIIQIFCLTFEIVKCNRPEQSYYKKIIFKEFV